MRVLRFRIGRDRFALFVDDARPTTRVPLTRAEQEVAGLVRATLSNAEIARVRGTSVHTVGNQVASVMRKLGVGSRVELALACSQEVEG